MVNPTTLARGAVPNANVGVAFVAYHAAVSLLVLATVYCSHRSPSETQARQFVSRFDGFALLEILGPTKVSDSKNVVSAPDCPRYLQMPPDDSTCPRMTSWSYYPGKVFYQRERLL